MCSYIIIGMKTEGLNLFNRIFVKGSKTEYDTKKIESAALYFPFERGWPCGPKLACRPTIFALPIFVRSRKARR